MTITPDNEIKKKSLVWCIHACAQTRTHSALKQFVSFEDVSWNLDILVNQTGRLKKKKGKKTKVKQTKNNNKLKFALVVIF